MALKKDENTFVQVMIFIISPFLSLPFILHGIYEKNKRSVVFLIGVISLMSYLYVPLDTNDKAYYYYLYDDFKLVSISDFLSLKPDYIFYLLIYIFSMLNIPLDFLFLGISFITMLLLYSSFFKLLEGFEVISKKNFFIITFLILFSVSPPSLFSGIRFTLASALILYSFVYTFFRKKINLRSILLIIGAILVHFSVLVFLPLYFIVFFFKERFNKLFLILFILSFGFLFIPKDFLISIISGVGLSEVLETKAQSYLGGEDFITNSVNSGNFNNRIRTIFQSLWFFISAIYILLNKTKTLVLRNIFLLVASFTNAFYVVPTVYLRYLAISLFFFVFLLINDFVNGAKNKVTIYILFIILSLNFFGNIYSLRKILVNSIMEIHSLTLPTILMKDNINYEDVQ
ncbi:conserved membrane protein of unknown function [Tenacibaculum sp. 190524A02b]|uniref:EpsG family protein n=1 Tax=Tenacibaculum vairaonense TaxID=3137860 RepID=UPI0032B21CC9